MKTSRRALLPLLAGALLWASAALAHPYSTSRAEVDWNEKTQRFEVALAVLPEELVQMIEAARPEGSKAERFRLGATPEVDAEIAAYLRKHFAMVSAEGEEAKLEWVGKEVAFEATWLYFELVFAKPPAKLEGMTMRVDLGLELSHDHVSAVQVHRGEDRWGLLFSRLEREIRLQ